MKQKGVSLETPLSEVPYKVGGKTNGWGKGFLIPSDSANAESLSNIKEKLYV
ncbi:hypothetical protein QFZ28_003918 [Neobacillus niacini]|nr:hypothetical protein [Neobacillus niacini]